MNPLPFRTNEEIWAEADRLRAREDVQPYAGPPVDIFTIVDVCMRLNIIDFPGLAEKYSWDATLDPETFDILVDQAAYLRLDKGDPWIERRLRFSIAHKVAHIVLHGEQIRSQSFKSFAEFKFWTANVGNFRRPEIQADEFAGRLLVPRESLLRWYDFYRARAEKNHPDWQSRLGVRTWMAKEICPRFGVTHKVIETRFDREGIWPIS